MAKAVFLDRDGTINEDPGYIKSPDEFFLIPGAGEALKLLCDAGFIPVVVTNQSGISRGIVPAASLSLIHIRMNELLKAFGVKIEHVYFCHHLPDAGCTCRKPGTALIEEASRKADLDVSQSYMVGDRLTDLECGRRAGCKGVCLVRTGDGLLSEQKMLDTERSFANFVGDSILDVARWIVSQ